MEFDEKGPTKDTPSQALMKALELFGENEPQNVLIVWESEEYVHALRNGMSYTAAIGLAEFVKTRYLQRLMGEK